MNTEDIQKLALDALSDLQAIDIVCIDVRSLTSITDYMVVCSGRSTRHVKSLADNIVTKAKEAKVSFIKSEGDEQGEWVLVDLADVVIHIMLPATREFYNLEDLWEPIKHARENRG